MKVWVSHLLHLTVLGMVSAGPACDVTLGGIFQMRRSPAGLQREAATRAAFCAFFPNCTDTEYLAFNLPSPSLGSLYKIQATDMENMLNVTYYLFSESSEDSNSGLSAAISAVIRLLMNLGVVGFVGPNSSSTSRAVSPVAEVFGVPHISYASTSNGLSDSNSFPNFFRTVPQDDGQALVMVRFALRMGWTTLSVINTLDSYGANGAAALRESAVQNEIRLATRQEFFPGETKDFEIDSRLMSVRDTNVRVIVLFMAQSDAVRVLQRARTIGMTGRGWVWLTSDAFTGVDVSAFGIQELARGIIGFEPRSSFENREFLAFNKSWGSSWNIRGGIITNFQNHSNSNFYVNLPPAASPRNYSAFGANYDTLVPFAYDAMTTLLAAVRSLAKKNVTPCMSQLMEYRAQLRMEMKNMTVNGTTGQISFDSNQDRIGAGYEILNHDGISWQTIATFAPNTQVDFSSPFNDQNSPVWPSGLVGVSNAPPDLVVSAPNPYEYRSYRVAYPVLAAVVFVGVVVCSIFVYRHRDDYVFKAAAQSLVQVMNLGHLLLLCVIFAAFPRPSDGSCVMMVLLGHLGFVLAVGSLFVKNYRVAQIFYNTNEKLKSIEVSDCQLFGYLSVGVGILAVYMILWGVIDPPRAGRQTDTNDSNLYYDVCTSNIGWYVALVVVELAFLMVGVIIAWQIRDAPTKFNESKAIGTSLYAIFFVSIIVLGAFIGISENPDLSYAVLSIGILLCVVTMQFSIIGTKFHRLYTNKSETSSIHFSSRGDSVANKEEKKVYKSIRRFKDVSKLIRNHTRTELANMLYNERRNVVKMEGKLYKTSRSFRVSTNVTRAEGGLAVSPLKPVDGQENSPEPQQLKMISRTPRGKNTDGNEKRNKGNVSFGNSEEGQQNISPGDEATTV